MCKVDKSLRHILVVGKEKKSLQSHPSMFLSVEITRLLPVVWVKRQRLSGHTWDLWVGRKVVTWISRGSAALCLLKTKRRNGLSLLCELAGGNECSRFYLSTSNSLRIYLSKRQGPSCERWECLLKHPLEVELCLSSSVALGCDVSLPSQLPNPLLFCSVSRFIFLASTPTGK